MLAIEDGTKHLAEIAALFQEYKAYIQVDVSFQPADETEVEIARRYGTEGGRLYLACVEKRELLQAANTFQTYWK